MKPSLVARNFGALEAQRFESIILLKKGLTQSEVARKLRVTRQAVHKWWHCYRRGGSETLRHHAATGRPLKFAADHRTRLFDLLGKNALAYGFPTGLWTLDRIVQLIERHFGLSLHRSHVHRLLTTSGWSCQKPVGRAVERDEPAIRRWVRDRWPGIKKKPGRARPH